MTYNKPKDVTYTQMAIWIDDNAYLEDCDQEKLYTYLYHLSFMLAKKHDYFTSSDIYDRFALYCANSFLLRLKSKRQFIEGEKRVPRIKSILNYIKKVIPHCKFHFEEELYGGGTSDVSITSIDNPVYQNTLIDEDNPIEMIEFSVSLQSINVIIKNYLKKIPHKKNSPEWTNIYISCLLTLLNSITPNAEQLEKLSKASDDFTIGKLYTQMRDVPPILYHLDTSMTTYIKVLVNELRKVISTELSWRSHTYYNADATLQNLLISNIEEMES